MAEYPRIADKQKYLIGKQFAMRIVVPSVGEDGWQQPPYVRRATVIRTSSKVLDRNVKLTEAAKKCAGTKGRPAFRACVKKELKGGAG